MNKETLRSASTKKAIFLCRLLTVIVAFCLIVGQVSFSFAAEDKNADNLSSYKSTLISAYDDVLSWKLNSCNAPDLTSLVDGFFCENALNGNVQNYVLALMDAGRYELDFSKYAISLAAQIEDAVISEKGIFPTSLQKSVIVLQKCLENNTEFFLEDYLSDTVLTEALSNTIGQKGIMSYVYGLKMLDYCSFSRNQAPAFDISGDEITCSGIVLKLLKLQLSDGGYALSGNVGDIDVTAMVLQSLAPAYLYYKNSDASANVSPQTDAYSGHIPYQLSASEATYLLESVSASVKFLAKNQLPTGDYVGYSSACSESTAQVILALCELELINRAQGTLDENEPITPSPGINGLLLYRTDEGGFSHTNDNITNDMASSQALCAIAKVLRSLASDADSVKQLPVKAYIFIGIGAVYFISLIVIVLRNKKSARSLRMQLISVTLLAGIAALLVFFINISSKERYENAAGTIISDEKDAVSISVSFYIGCNTVSDKVNKTDIFPVTQLSVSEGTTVFELLSEVCRINGIQLDYDSSTIYGTAYIKSIDSLYEFDYGDLSGWMYRVNGEFPSVGCGGYTLKDGDMVEWLYTTNIGEDLKEGN